MASGGGKGLSCGLERMDKSRFLGVSTYADDRKKPLLHAFTFEADALLPNKSLSKVLECIGESQDLVLVYTHLFKTMF